MPGGFDIARRRSGGIRGVGRDLVLEGDVVVRRRLTRQLGQTRRGIGLGHLVGVRGVHEPLHGVGLATGRGEVVRIRVEQAGAPRVAARRVQLRHLEADDGRVQLTEVAPGAGGDDRELDGLGPVELARLGASCEIERTLGAAEGTLDVGHHREVAGTTAHAASGTQLPEGLGPLTRVVGGDAGRLADQRDPRRAVPGVAGMSQRLVRVVVDERARGDEVPRDGLGRVLLQATQVTTDLGVQLGGRHVVGERRRRDPDLVGIAAIPALSLVTGPALRRATGLGACGPVAIPVWRPTVVAGAGGPLAPLVAAEPVIAVAGSTTL